MISRESAFCCLVLLLSPAVSSSRPRVEPLAVFLSQVAPSARNSANWDSNENEYNRIWRQLLKEDNVSFSVKSLIFGARDANNAAHGACRACRQSAALGGVCQIMEPST